MEFALVWLFSPKYQNKKKPHKRGAFSSRANRLATKRSSPQTSSSNSHSKKHFVLCTFLRLMQELHDYVDYSINCICNHMRNSSYGQVKSYITCMSTEPIGNLANSRSDERNKREKNSQKQGRTLNQFLKQNNNGFHILTRYRVTVFKYI